jgi:acyl-homoserine lactone acylase PvdQ
MLRLHLLAAAAVAFTLTLPATATAQDLTGFRSVLAQGQGRNATAADLAANQATGAVPPEFTNQLALYADLAVEWPGLTPDRFDRYFKVTDFGPAPTGSGVRVDVPRPGVTITREPRFAIPRVDGKTRDDVMFGAGYAQAQDRLFLMDVLRRTARGSLSELVGPSGVPGDAATLTQQDFSEAELVAQFEALDERHGPEGARVQQDLREFVAGINAFIDEVRDDPARIPAEYPALGVTPAPWTLADSAAQATFLVSQFNVAGLGERTNAAILATLEERHGPVRARAMFDELRLLDDREAPTTADRLFADDRPGRVRPAAVAVPDADSVKPRNALVGTAPAPGTPPPFVQGVLNLPRALPPTKSNAVLLSGRLSASGRPLASMGPQVGYFSPQIFSELELHGGGFDVQGVVFPGAAPYVLIGHGKGFAWSGTSPMSDLADTFVERLCDPAGKDVGDPTKATHYLHRGRCTPFVTREQVIRTPPPSAGGAREPAQTVTLKTLRSVHGPVTHFAEVEGDPVAITQQKTVDFRELDAALAFARLNTNQLKDAESFRRVWRDYPGGENWFYISEREVGWQLSGFMPRRARGVDPDLPTWGTGAYDWRGILPFERLPHSVEPSKGYIISWNNKEAPGWRAPSDTWTLGPTHRSELLERRLKAELRRSGGKTDLAGLVRTTEAAALGDLEGQELLPLLRRLVLPVAGPGDRELLDLLERWRTRGAEHRDLDRDGQYEDPAAIQLMRAWMPLLVRRVFEPTLGAEGLAAVRQALSLEPGRSEFGGWHGQLHRVLRGALGRRVRKAPRAVQCARGRRTTCARTALAALRDADALLRERFGGGPDRWRSPVELQPITTAGAIPTPRFPLQNRGTYHQVVELRPRG